MRSIRLLNAFSYEYSPFTIFTLCPDTFDRHLYVKCLYCCFCIDWFEKIVRTLNLLNRFECRSCWMTISRLSFLGSKRAVALFNNLKKSSAYILTSNMSEFVAFLVWLFLRFPLPLGPITVLFINLGTDMVPGIMFAYDTHERGIMNLPPRDAKRDRLVSLKTINWVYPATGVVHGIGALIISFIIMGDAGFWPKIYSGRAQSLSPTPSTTLSIVTGSSGRSISECNWNISRGAAFSLASCR